MATEEILFVNLSALHTLHPISKGIDAFAKLYRDPPVQKRQVKQSGCNKCCNFFTTLYDRSWITLTYYRNLDFINQYKQGQVTSEAFLTKMKEIFPFVNQHPNAEELLMGAWNAIIELNEKTAEQFAQLQEFAQGKTICFISNTNEINARYVFQHLLPEIEPPDLSHDASLTSPKIIPLGKNLFFAPSYRTGCFKTNGLIELLGKEEQFREKRITVISQFQPDLDTATRLGFTAMHATQLFGAEQKLKKM